jgi:hypothetical protein
VLEPDLVVGVVIGVLVTEAAEHHQLERHLESN